MKSGLELRSGDFEGKNILSHDDVFYSLSMFRGADLVAETRSASVIRRRFYFAFTFILLRALMFCQSRHRNETFGISRSLATVTGITVPF